MKNECSFFFSFLLFSLFFFPMDYGQFSPPEGIVATKLPTHGGVTIKISVNKRATSRLLPGVEITLISDVNEDDDVYCADPKDKRYHYSLLIKDSGKHTEDTLVLHGGKLFFLQNDNDPRARPWYSEVDLPREIRVGLNGSAIRLFGGRAVSNRNSQEVHISFDSVVSEAKGQ